MEPVTTDLLMLLAQRLGERLDAPLRLYLLGGSAMLLLGSPRATKDVDDDLDIGGEDADAARRTIGVLATELRLDLEFVPMAEYVPLPAGFEERHQWVGQFGAVELFIFDPYSLALSKIARGFEADLQDVVFLVRRGIVEFESMQKMFREALPKAWDADIDPSEFRQYFDELKRLLEVES